MLLTPCTRRVIAAAILVSATSVSAQVELDEAQRQWLDAHPVIRVAPDPDFPPFEFFGEDGRYDGIAADYIRLLEERLGVRFTIVREEKWETVLVKARAREVDLLAAAGKTPQRTEYLVFTEPHIKLPGVIIASGAAQSGTLTMGDLAGRKVAVVAGYVWEDLVTADHPEIELVPVPSIVTALEMVSFGVVDAMIGDQATTTYFIQQEALTNLRVAGRPGYEDGLAIGVRNDWPELIPILEAALATITAEEKAEIQRRWIHLEQPSIFARREFWVVSGSIAAGLVVLLAGIVAWNRSLKRLVNLRTNSLNEELAWRKEAEQELREHRDHLDELVNVRTDQLSQANRRMRRDLEAGAEYVRGLLSPPENDRVAIDWRYVPSSDLGGDTIGHHWIDDDHLAIFLIDVTGHGVDSALLSVTVMNIIRAASLPNADPRKPEEVLVALNDAFPGAEHGNKYFTIWYGVYRPSSRELTWSGGGHHPSLLFEVPGAPAMQLESGGPVIGAVKGLDYPAETHTVAPGARLLIFSDGAFEILCDDEVVWTLNAFISYVTARVWHSDDIMDDLLRYARQLRGTSQLEDDFSFIDVRLP